MNIKAININIAHLAEYHIFYGSLSSLQSQLLSIAKTNPKQQCQDKKTCSEMQQPLKTQCLYPPSWSMDQFFHDMTILGLELKGAM